eukprot:COSAG05_NODE_10886_length_541_cov_0.579186_1_plen_100_part_10
MRGMKRGLTLVLGFAAVWWFATSTTEKAIDREIAAEFAATGAGASANVNAEQRLEMDVLLTANKALREEQEQLSGLLSAAAPGAAAVPQADGQQQPQRQR